MHRRGHEHPDVVAALPNPGSPWRWLPSVTTIVQLAATDPAQGSARIQHHVGNRREPTGNNGQTISRQTPPLSPSGRPRINAMTSGYYDYRTSSPVTALPMIMCWISDVPSNIVKLVEVRSISPGRWPAGQQGVITSPAPRPPAARFGLARAYTSAGRTLNTPPCGGFTARKCL